nr:M6 family metalloprotease domain-containing protein [Micromonospora sp. DSM 115978]
MLLRVRSRIVVPVLAALVALAATAAPVSAAPISAPATATAAAVEECRLPAADVGNEHEGPTDYGRWLRPTGTVRAIVLFVYFDDATPASGEMARRTTEFAPASTWLTRSSYGAVDLRLSFDSAWRRMPQPQTAYASFNATFDNQRAYLSDAVAAADAAINFSQYQIVYVVPASTASALTNSAAFIAYPGWGVWADGVELRHGITFGHGLDDWGFEILLHETGHIFGLPDLYAYTPTNYHDAVGGWDLMGLVSGAAPDHFAWHKWKMGWLSDSQITCRSGPGSTTTTLTPLGETAGTKTVVVRTGERDAVVVENRQVSRLDQASGCFRPGVLVYRVTTSVGGGGRPPGGGDPVVGGARPIRVVDHAPNSPVAACDSDQAELANATLTAVGHTVTVDGVTVRVTAASGTSRTVGVTVA